jgi:serine/threonine-protein kinase
METIEKLGKYEIKRTLGKGAMGVVYEGWDPIIARRVAIKTVRIPDTHDDPEAEEGLQRFRREAQAAGRLTHPNIVGVFDYGEAGDIAYIVMEYVDGPSVKSLVDKHERFAIADTMRIMTDLLTGLQFSHDRGVVHRDIKPANVMLTTEGQGKIADFGIARIESSSMTQAGTVLGTPAYMSPEQFMGQVVDARTDIYSSGVLLYQLLTGERPFEGGMSAIMHKALNTDPPLPSQLTVTCPAAFDAVVRKAMAKRPEDRFQSASAFLDALRAAASGQPMAAAAPAPDDDEATMVAGPRPAAAPPPAPARGAPPPPVASAPRTAAAAAPGAPAPARSNLPMLAGVAVLVLLLLGGGVWFFVLRGPSSPAPVATAPVASSPATPATGGGPTAPVAPVAPVNQAQTAPVTPPPQPTPPAPVNPIAAPPTPPVATPSPPAQNEQVAAAGVDAIRRQIAQLVAAQRCATVDGDVRDGGAVTLSGLAGGSAADALRQALAGVTIPGALDWHVKAIDQTFCPALDLLHPIVPAFASTGARLGLTLAGDRLRLRDGEQILPRLVMPDFRGNLRVDYVAHDGGVLHLYPQQADPAQHMTADPPRVFGPGETINLGEASPGHPAWEVGEPYGTDMILAIASTAPLFDRPRPGNTESSADYLRDLQNAVDAARRRGVRLSGNALVVDTVAK